MMIPILVVYCHLLRHPKTMRGTVRGVTRRVKYWLKQVRPWRLSQQVLRVTCRSPRAQHAGDAPPLAPLSPDEEAVARALGRVIIVVPRAIDAD